MGCMKFEKIAVLGAVFCAATVFADWGQYLDPPAGYAAFPRSVEKLAAYSFPDFYVEEYRQANGPGTFQRLMIAVPKNAKKRLPAVVVPFYYPEAMLGFDPKTGGLNSPHLPPNTNLTYFAEVTYMSDLAKRGYITVTAEAIFNDRPLWNVPQTFSWAWYRKHLADRERFPTEQELKNMNWQHIALGANGLISYCYHGLWKYVKPEEFESHWRPICNAAAEVKKMMPVLLSVDEAPRVCGAPEMVPVRTWMHKGSLYILAVNAKTETQRVELTVQTGRWKAVSCEIGIAGHMVSHNRLSVELPPIGVSLMRLKPFN